MDALEEWISEDTEKYLGSKKLVDSWEDVASVVGSEYPEGIFNSSLFINLFIYYYPNVVYFYIFFKM